jgi:hypothetical protein
MNETLNEDITVLSRAAEVLSGISDNETYERVLQFLAHKRGFSVVRAGQSRTAGGAMSVGADAPEDLNEVKDFPTVFNEAHPETESEKALVGGYYLQVLKGQQDFDSTSINGMLRELGHGASNIARAMGDLMTSTPTLVMQTGKTGKGHHTRKRYRLTQAGRQRVEEMLEKSTQSPEH